MQPAVRSARSKRLPVLLVLLLCLPAVAMAGSAHLPARNSFGFKLGGYFPNGDSDLWELNESELTTSAEDFNDFAFAFDFTKYTSNNVAVTYDMMFYQGSDSSTDRAVGDLLQHSELTVVPATLGLKLMPWGKYRDGGPGYPGTPRTLVPYVALGGGVVLWEFEMEGEFEDPLDPDFFFVDRFVSDGITPALTAAAGIEIDMDGPWSMVVEGRYLWAQDDLSDDFVGFDEFDLSGTSFFVGASVRF